MKTIYWLLVAFLTCLGCGYLVAFTLQYTYYLMIKDWNILLIGGWGLGCLFFAPLFMMLLSDYFYEKRTKNLEDR
ncbi:unnamed protein product [marine sediment metagenome]|uniref:Uncharacterized protein n=1 Tax=marine sediment metagenome TaxID=412755 RepID=X1EPY6_9ZZZZ